MGIHILRSGHSRLNVLIVALLSGLSTQAFAQPLMDAATAAPVARLSAVVGQPITKPSTSPVSITDVIEARTIDSLSVSPDGQWIAYRIIRRSVQTDTILGQWYKTRIDGTGTPIALGRTFVPLEVMLMSMPQDGVSQWAPDSSSLYVLAEGGSGVQIHRLGDGDDASVTADEADVITFTIAPDGSALTYQTRNARKTIDQAMRDEAASGIHFDQSIITDGLALANNFRIGGRVTTIRRFPDQTIGEANRGGLQTRHIVLGPQKAESPDRSSVSTKLLPVIHRQDAAAGEARLAMGVGKPTIILRQLRKAVIDDLPGLSRIEADLPGGKHVICPAAFCSGESSAMRLITFNDKTDEAIVLLEPNYTVRTTIYAWNPASGATRVVRPARGSLDDGSIFAAACPARDHYLICVEAGPTQPPRLTRLDLRGGGDLVLDDPNKDLAARHFPQVRTISWKDPAGTAWNGVLVLPEDRPSRNLPLVITTYRCRGFLQGGTGWLTSEFALAQKGIAALCMNANADIFGQRDQTGKLLPMRPYDLLDQGFAGAIDKLSDEGIIDRSRVGISGHSLSANAATYAISHTKLFHAAVIGSGVTIDPATYTLVAPAADSWRHAVYDILGMPKPDNDPNHLWEKVSPALNARSIDAPILMQTTENEYHFNLQQYAYLQDAHKVVDMYVYPGEGHMASGRPIHQFWRNQRSVDWFVKWLLPSSRPD